MSERIRYYIQIVLSVLVCMAISTLQSCSSEKGNRGEWIKSVEGIKVYVPLDFKEHYDKSTLHCMARYWSKETNIPMPPFKISVKRKDTGKISSFDREHLPSIIPVDSLIYKYKNGTFSVYAGTLDDGKCEGYAWDLTYSRDSVLQQVEVGKFKNNILQYGYTVKINDSGTTVLSEGRFKNGHLYLGIKEISTNGLIENQVAAVWDKDGMPNETYSKFANQFFKTLQKLDYNDNQYEKARLGFAHRYFFWVKYKWCFLVGFSLIGILAVLLIMAFSRPLDSPNEEEKWDIEHYRVKPWTTFGAFWRWFVFGLFRVDAFYLRQYGYCAVCNLMLWIAIVASSKFIILYGLNPEYWLGLLKFAFDYWQAWLIMVCIVLWIIGLFTDSYIVYKLNLSVYRHNIYERLILRNSEARYAQLLKEIPEAVKRDTPTIKEISKSARDEYSNEQSWLSKSFSWLTKSKVRHARNKAEYLNDCLQTISEIAQNHARLLSQLADFLDIERKNAYRNMLLAKEMIFLVKKGKGNQRKLIKGELADINPDVPEFVVLKPDYLPEVDYQDSFIAGFKTFDSTFGMLKDLGIDDKDNALISLGLGVMDAALMVLLKLINVALKSVNIMNICRQP